MLGTVEILNLSNVRSMRFDLPPAGVWLLTGANGSGKTSLLPCLRRIGNSNAFPLHFPISLQSTKLDNFDDARIIYKVSGDQVEYAYRGERWAPRPRRNSHLLAEFGYPEVIYVGVNADRITPRPDDFEPNRVRSVPVDLSEGMNAIFETAKYNDLRQMNLTRGGGNKAYLLRVPNVTPIQFLSEKQFSLGELCVLKLLNRLVAAPPNALVLIDELEMALHPRAQA